MPTTLTSHFGTMFSITTFLLAVAVAFKLARALYNISPLHPLSRFPGPKLAAMTICYEGFFDLIMKGRYTWEIRRMHEIYGPVIRINPSELHCNDPSLIDDIYAVGGRHRNKTPHTCRSLVPPLDSTIFETVEHNLHRVRRQAMARYFSRQYISRFEPRVISQLQLLREKLLRSKGQGAVDVTTAYSCFTTDVISLYSFGEPLGLLTQDGWEPNWRRPTYSFLNTTFVFRFLPALRTLVSIGTCVARWCWMGSDIKMLMHTLHTRIPDMIFRVQADARSDTSDKSESIFRELLDSRALPASEKTLSRLSAEGMALLSGGTETTAWALSVVTFYVLSKPEVMERLSAEVGTAFPGAAGLSWSKLEKLPYMRGVILESLRLSYGISARSPRIATTEALVYRARCGDMEVVEHVIPRGWAIGASSAIFHHNETVFPNSDAFVPERWSGQNGVKKKKLEKCLLSFSRGSRQCLGINLAHCELYLAVAFLTLELFPRIRLYETTEDDVKYDHDLIIPMTRKGSRGVRVVIS